jgi:CheY-like chemotaxis protein
VKLIVVEDEERVASFLEKGLRAHGYSVEWVPNAQDALQRVMDPGISLVILDLGLPDLDGLDVLEGMRQRGSTVPVLVLSARGRVDDGSSAGETTEEPVLAGQADQSAQLSPARTSAHLPASFHRAPDPTVAWPRHGNARAGDARPDPPQGAASRGQL